MPRQVVERLIQARAAGASRQIEALVVPGAAPSVLATLAAVDEFLSINRSLCDHVRRHVTPGLAAVIDQSRLGDNLDIFSAHVEILSERIDGEQAEVSFLVGGQIPARHARLVRTNEGWRYDPGEGYDPALPAAFRRMADGLRIVLEDLKSGRLPAEELRRNPQRLIEEVRLRLMPGVKMLPAATRSAGG